MIIEPDPERVFSIDFVRAQAFNHDHLTEDQKE